MYTSAAVRPALVWRILGRDTPCQECSVSFRPCCWPSPPDFDNTYVELRARGYTDAQIKLPDWGSKTCPA